MVLLLTPDQVELELQVNTANPNYDRSKGEQLALNVDGPKAGSEDKPRVFQSMLMDKQVGRAGGG